MLSRALARLTRQHTPPACPAGVQDADELPSVMRDLAAFHQARAKVVRREIFAAQLVAYVREQSMAGYWLPSDIDELAAWLCQRHHIEPIAPDLLRESVAGLPGVHHSRARLLSRPELKHIRYRLRVKGLPDDRAWVYHIADAVPEAVAPPPLRPDAAAAPPDARPGRSKGRPAAGQNSGPDAGSKKHRTIADVRHPGLPAPAQASCGSHASGMPRGTPERQANRRAA